MSNKFLIYPPEISKDKNLMWLELGIESGDKWEDVKKKYKDLAKKYHPDNQETGNKIYFKRIHYHYKEFEAFRKEALRQGFEYP